MSTRLFRSLVLTVIGASVSWATLPPNEVLRHAAYDTLGRSWSVRAGRELPLEVVGPRTYKPVLATPFDYLALRFAIDGDRLWVGDGSPRVLSLSLTDGSAKETKLPLPRLSDLVARGGQLFAGFSDGDVEGVLRFDPATGKSERVFEGKLPGTLLTIGTGPSRVWIATWAGFGTPRLHLDLIGVPASKTSKDTPRRATYEVEWAGEGWSGFALREDEGGDLWLANTYAGRVERLDSSGVWTSWPVGPERLVSVAPLGSSVVALVAAMEPHNPQALPGIPRMVRSQSLVVIDPASKTMTRTTLAAGSPVESLASAGGRVWIANGREVKIVGGRAVTSDGK
jgi:hypothetical protein